MFLSSPGDFDYDNQTSSSDTLPGSSLAGDSGSGRADRYRNSDAFAGLTGGFSSSNSDDHASGINDNERRNDNFRPTATRWRNERPNFGSRTTSYQLSRDDLRDLAFGTLRILDDGEYFPPFAVEPYDLKMKISWSEDNTRYYGPDAGEGGEISESEFIKINQEGGVEGEHDKEDEREKDGKMGAAGEAESPYSLHETKQGEIKLEYAAITASNAKDKQIHDNSDPKTQAQTTVPPVDTRIFIGEYSTLIGARKVHLALASNLDSSDNKKIGVLNFASAKKPGGGFINGSQAQEESIARSSTLYPSLLTGVASQFYKHHEKDPTNAYYTHAMVYSPGVILLRDDYGEWRSPVEVDVLTSAAVNAGEIRRNLAREERQRVELEFWKRKAEETRRERERYMAEVKKRAEKAKIKKEKAEAAKLKKESKKLQKEAAKNKDGDEIKDKDKRKATDKGKEKEEASVEPAKSDTEAEKEEEEAKAGEKATDSPESENSSGSDLKKAEEDTESKETQDDQPRAEAPVAVNQEPTSHDQPQPEAPVAVNQELTSRDEPQPEASAAVNQEPTSSSTIPHRLSPHTWPLQSDLTYTLALSDAETKIKHAMYTRISRILHLFQLHQTPHLILGSFGTGVFQNRVELIAGIFADLLIKPDGRFKNVFKTTVFAILGKETVRAFTDVFSRADKRAQRTTGRMCVFLDLDRGDGDIKEGEEERRTRIMRWEARRTDIANAAQAEADAASFAAAQADIYATSSAQTNVHAASLAQADACASPFLAAQADAVASPFLTAQADAVVYTVDLGVVSADPANLFLVAGDDGIPEDEKMVLTHDGETVDPVPEAATHADDGKDVEMVEIQSNSDRVQNLESNHGDIEMQ